MGRALLLLSIAAASLNIPLAAGTVTMQARSNLPPFISPPNWGTSCSQSDTGPVSCFLQFGFDDPTGRQSVGGNASATADFGYIAGFIVGGGTNAYLSASYDASFADYVTVLGGSGQGRLITHYQLASADEANGVIPSFAVPPSYSFLQAGFVDWYTPNLQHIPFDNPDASLTESFDVSTPITFGQLILLGASTHTEFSFYAESGRGSSLYTSASAKLTGYTVLDSDGTILSEASVQRSLSDAPEPGTLWLGIGGTLILLGSKRLRRRPAKR